MSKYKYNLYAERYGGETVIGEVNEAFVDYWIDRVDDEGDHDLVEFLTDWDIEMPPEDALDDPDSAPFPTENFEPGQWHELDDIEHLSSCYADADIRVVPLDADGEEDNENEFYVPIVNLYAMYSREAYIDSTTPDWNTANRDEYIPVVTFHSGEKGGFWNATLELDEPFDQKLLSVGNIETHLCEMTEALFYNKEPVEFEYDYADTTGKGYYAAVGYMNTRWHDKQEKYDVGGDNWNELCEEFDDNLEWERQQGDD